MPTYLPFTFLDNHFLLSANRTMFWEEKKMLILSDLHLGKSGHFRKHGIGIPQSMFKEDMQRLLAEIQFYKPGHLIIVGDLFHSCSNKEHEYFSRWRKDIAHISIHLIIGNHDILEDEWYAANEIMLHEGSLQMDPFIFTHDINDIKKAEKHYCISGHIHPGIKLKGLGKQSLRLACFYFNKAYAVLPAFGKFTGTFNVKIKKEDAVFAVSANNIIQVQ